MSRLFLFFLVLLGIYIWRRSLRQAAQKQMNDQQHPFGGTAPLASGDQAQVPLRACEHCGVLVPENEGVSGMAGFFCSTEHARLGRKVEK